MSDRQRTRGLDDTGRPRLEQNELDARSLAAGGLMLAAMFSTSACGMGYALGASQAKPLVIMHAEDDLDCPASDLHVEEEWGGRWEAKGCGRHAIYNAKCEGIDCQVLPEDKPVPWADRPAYDPGAKH